MLAALFAVLGVAGVFMLRNNAIVIDWSAVHQTIDGFGAATGDDPVAISDSLMNFFYSTADQGIGLTFIRVKIYPNFDACVADNTNASQCINAPGATLTGGALANLQAAAARGATVWAAEWTPPKTMKTSASYSTGAMIGNRATYTELASIMENYVGLLADTHKIPVYAVSVQNEPDYSATDHETTIWTAQQLHDFIPYLRSALNAGGHRSTRIMVGEQSEWRFDSTSLAMGDASTAASVDILAAHNYDQKNPSKPPTFPNFTRQRVWETEVSTINDAYDGSIGNALIWAQRIHYSLSAARINAWHYWHLSGVPNDYTDNQALTDRNGTIALRAYAIGNWSKFVRPGWHEIEVGNSGSLLATAFQDQTGIQFAIVVVNKASSPVQGQAFLVGAAVRDSVIPWITSSTQSLVRQSPVAVAGGRFVYSVPARSVVTFVGRRAPGAALDTASRQ